MVYFNVRQLSVSFKTTLKRSREVLALQLVEISKKAFAKFFEFDTQSGKDRMNTRKRENPMRNTIRYFSSGMSTPRITHGGSRFTGHFFLFINEKRPQSPVQYACLVPIPVNQKETWFCKNIKIHTRNMLASFKK